MRRFKVKLKKSWGIRQSLGLGIILASITLSFLLVSCGTEDATPVAQAGGNKLNAPNQQAVTPGTTVPNAGQPAAPTAANTVLVVVAVRPIETGTILTATDLDLVPKPRGEVNPDQDITQIQGAINRINKVPYNPGQQIKKGDLVEGTFSSYMRQLVSEKRLEPGKKAFAYATNDLSSVGGLIQENDLVDVVATYIVERRSPVPAGSQVAANTTDKTVTNNPGLELTTKTVLQNVRVLKVIRLQVRSSETIAKPTATSGPDTPTAVVAVAPTASPTPTLQPFAESGVGFQVNTILILGVTDQEAEVLKFTREYRLSGTSGRVNSSNPVVATGDTQFGPFGDLLSVGGVAVVHFILRAKPQDPANPVDPATQVERTTGVTFRILIRDYGLQIPELVFASNTQ